MKLLIHKKANKKGFTLIELLVVIAILATLSGLAYGPIMKHLRGADLLKAKKVCKDLVAAIDSFESEYDSLPYTGSYPDGTSDNVTGGVNIETDDADFLKVLMGIDTDINDRGKQFFTADNADGERDGLIYTGTDVTKLVDKWKNVYTIRLDYSADGIIDATKIGAGSSYKDNIRASAIVASPGPNALFDDKQDAISW